MKLTGADARAFFSDPDLTKIGCLLHGADQSLVQARRRKLAARISDSDDLRTDRVQVADLRRDPALLHTLLRARGFFAGRRVVMIEDAGDGLAKILDSALADATPEDAFLIVTADALPARSALRRRFETDPSLVSIGLYADQPRRQDIEAMLGEAGLSEAVEPAAIARLTELAAELDHGSLQQLIVKIASFQFGSESKLDVSQLEELAPVAADSRLDALIDAVVDGRTGEIGSLVTRLSAGAVGPVQMMIATSGRFRQLLAIASAEDGPERAISRLRPPVYGERARMLGLQARRWGPQKLEAAIHILHATDARLRSPGAKPDLAIAERALIRLAMMAGRR